jgi:hypothetical protein
MASLTPTQRVGLARKASHAMVARKRDRGLTSKELAHAKDVGRKNAHIGGFARAMALTPERRSAIGHLAGAASKLKMSHAQRVAAGKKASVARLAKTTPEERSARAAHASRVRWAGTTAEERSLANVSPLAAAQLRNRTMTPAERSRIASTASRVARQKFYALSPDEQSAKQRHASNSRWRRVKTLRQEARAAP